jgi:hypothetical protein
MLYASTAHSSHKGDAIEVAVVTKRTLAWTILTVLGLAGILAVLWSAFGTSRVAFTQADLQARIDKMLPKIVKDITVERVTVTFADDRLMLKVEAQGRKLGQPFTVVASARGRPRYDPDRAALFFEPDAVTIEDLTLRGSSVGERVERAAGRLKGRLGEIVKEKASAIDAAAARIAEQGVKLYLSTFPIYRPKEDAKGLVVRAALRAVAIEDSSLFVTFSLWALTAFAVAWGLLLLALAVFAVQLTRHPGWGRSRLRT